MIRQKFYHCEKCGSEYGRKTKGHIRCDRCKLPREEPKRFADQRDRPFTKWVVEHLPCAVAGLVGRRTLKDGRTISWLHECRGPNTFAHCYRKRAQGVGDKGQGANLCLGAHTLGANNQEDHRDEFWGWYSLDRDDVVKKTDAAYDAAHPAHEKGLTV
jgi:hypothetical protein